MKRPFTVVTIPYNFWMDMAHMGTPAILERQLGIQITSDFQYHRVPTDKPGALARMLNDHFNVSVSETDKLESALDQHNGHVAMIPGVTSIQDLSGTVTQLAVFQDTGVSPAPSTLYIYTLHRGAELQFDQNYQSRLATALGLPESAAKQLLLLDLNASDTGALNAVMASLYGVSSDDQVSNTVVTSEMEGLAVLFAAERGAVHPLRHPHGDALKLILTCPATQSPSPEAIASRTLTAQKRPKSDARIGGMVATVALILMFAFMGLLIWMTA